MRFISLFTGIGGLDLGLERAGWECVAQVEWDDYCTRVLERHWPNIPRWRDIHDVSPEGLPDCDAVVGGFPCQPVSLAGARLAQDDPRWLWPEFFRIVRHIRPRVVIVENVPGLASAGMGDVLGDLAQVGYDAEWQSVPAAAVGAPHLRWRIFIVAYPRSVEHENVRDEERRTTSEKLLAYPQRDGVRVEPVTVTGRRGEAVTLANGKVGHVADTTSVGPSDRNAGTLQGQPVTKRPTVEPERCDWWAVEPDVGRVAHGIPNRVDRLRGLGNAVVPQVAEWIGHRINNNLR